MAGSHTKEDILSNNSISLVFESAIQAFNSINSGLTSQPTLAFLRDQQVRLFEDIRKTLIEIPKSDDILVSTANSILGQHSELQAKDLLRWIRQNPSGIAWPVTMSTSVSDGKISSPMRVVVMIPMDGDDSYLSIPKGVSRLLGEKLWGDCYKNAIGSNAALFVGMFCDANGHWEYGPIAVWVFAENESSSVEAKVVSLIPNLIKIRAETENKSYDEIHENLAFNYVIEDLLCIAAAGR